MNLSSEQAVKALFKKDNIRPLKKLGQNFLIDKEILDKIIQAAQLSEQNTVLEIGPGVGVLTQGLAKKTRKVIAVEKDKKLTAILKQNFLKKQNVEIVEGDILRLSIAQLFDCPIVKDYKVVSNLPYNIALPVIRKLVEEKNPPKMMILMLQKEVAQKICAKKSSLPKIAIELYAKSEILFYVPKELFWPQPKVNGAVIKVTDIQKNALEIDKNLFFKILKAGFAHPRKTILNNLYSVLKLEKEKTRQWLNNSDISPKNRAEDLTLKNWLSLLRNFDL